MADRSPAQVHFVAHNTQTTEQANQREQRWPDGFLLARPGLLDLRLHHSSGAKVRPQVGLGAPVAGAGAGCDTVGTPPS